MIVVGMLLVIALIGAYLFLGMKISESIVHGDIKIFFWALYTVTLLTLVNVSLSAYFYSSLKDKKGPLGPRGVKGKMGDSGTDGSCDGGECKAKTVQILIEQRLEQHYDENDITPLERKTICNLINNEDNTTNPIGNKNIIKEWNYEDLKIFNDNLSFTFPQENKLKQRIKKQEINDDFKKGIIDAITHATETFSNSKKLNENMTTECI
jgi:hypothetical protein